MIKLFKHNGLFALYSIYVLIVLIMTVPALTFFIGVNWFCTESIYIIYLGGVSFVNTLYVVLKSSGFVLAILLTSIINKKLLVVTKDYDSRLENNVTIIKAYDKFKIDIVAMVPFIIDLVTAYISYFWLYKKNPNTAIIILILLSFWEVVIVKATLDNLISLAKFVKKTNNV
ncbi:MAG: hypothetical protein RBR48_03980 [Bacilli bacterium]|nr:hypothetical protein [Bacilli bacterium]MDD3348284.1 hypothetical protein [Bacilli bacterium]MDY0209319.1 hypothetical protein [Bacilli bacterium]